MCLCLRHHHLKHDNIGWTVRRTRDGTVTWVSPTGHVIIQKPETYPTGEDPGGNEKPG